MVQFLAESSSWSLSRSGVWSQLFHSPMGSPSLCFQLSGCYRHKEPTRSRVWRLPHLARLFLFWACPLDREWTAMAAACPGVCSHCSRTEPLPPIPDSQQVFAWASVTLTFNSVRWLIPKSAIPRGFLKDFNQIILSSMYPDGSAEVCASSQSWALRSPGVKKGTDFLLWLTKGLVIPCLQP